MTVWKCWFVFAKLFDSREVCPVFLAAATAAYRRKNQRKLLHYKTTVKAHEDTPGVIDTVLSQYAGYIRYFSKVHGQIDAEAGVNSNPEST